MSKQRFYDREPVVSQAVELIFAFPEPIQEIVALGLSQIANQEFRANELMNNVKSMGSENVLAMFKSKRRRRAYDNNQITHQAMNHLFILPNDKRIFVSEKVVELVRFVEELIRITNRNSATVDLEAVRRIVEAYVQFGPEESRRFLEAVRAQFLRSLGADEVVVSEDEAGLRLRRIDPL